MAFKKGQKVALVKNLKVSFNHVIASAGKAGVKLEGISLKYSPVNGWETDGGHTYILTHKEAVRRIDAGLLSLAKGEVLPNE